MSRRQKIERALERSGLQWQYVLWSPNYPLRYKVGWSAQFSVRHRDIQRTMREKTGRKIWVFCLLKAPVFWAKKNEAAIHGCALWRPARNMPGSGHTEWSWSINVICFIMAYMFFPGSLWTLLALVPLPFDLALCTILLALVQYAFVGFVVWAVIHLLQTMF